MAANGDEQQGTCHNYYLGGDDEEQAKLLAAALKGGAAGDKAAEASLARQQLRWKGPGELSVEIFLHERDRPGSLNVAAGKPDKETEEIVVRGHAVRHEADGLPVCWLYPCWRRVPCAETPKRPELLRPCRQNVFGHRGAGSEDRDGSRGCVGALLTWPCLCRCRCGN